MFLNRLIVSPTKGDNWVLMQPFGYVDSKGAIIDVPKGFECDLASIPAVFRPLFPVNGDWTEAAVIHDYLYHYRIGRRSEADRIFREAMKELGVPAWRRWTMWAAVRTGGWMAWND